MWSGADRRGQLGVDQFLHPVLQQPAKQLPAVTLTEPRQQVRYSGIIVMGHRVNTFLSEFFVVLTKGHAMAHPTGGPPTYLHHITGRQREEEATERGATRTARNVNRTRRDLGAIDGDELPIRNYDSLTATSAIERIERLRDVDDLRAVLAYEAANKARKGVTNAIEGRLEQLVAELAAAS